jgi:hypothetical protein
MDERGDDEDLAAFQQALIETLLAHEDGEKMAGVFRKVAPLAQYADYVDAIEPRAAELASFLVRRWTRREGHEGNAALKAPGAGVHPVKKRAKRAAP